MKVIPPPPEFLTPDDLAKLASHQKNDFKSPYCSAKVIEKVKEQIQKEIQAVSALKLAPSVIEDLCQIVENNFKSLEI